MKTLVLSMISIAATVAAMTACTSEDIANEQTVKDLPTPVVFGSTISEITSKAVTENATSFGENDKIGVTMYVNTEQVAPSGTSLGSPKYSNVTYKSDASGNLKEDGSSSMFWERENYHYFYAYYPTTTDENYTHSSASGSDSEKLTVKVKADGTTTDLLLGSNTTGIKFEGLASATSITFKHMLSKIKFVFKKDASYTKVGTLTSISFKVDKESISYNLVEPGAGTPSSTTGITLTQTGLNYTIESNSSETTLPDWAPIVVPNSTVTDLSLNIDGATLSSSSINGLSLQPGYMTKIIITLKSSGAEFTSNIDAWANGGTNGDTDIQ